MAKLKDIPFGSEIPTFDNDGYITLSNGLRDSSGNAIISMDCSGLALFAGEAMSACYASYTSEACCACYACYASYTSEACCACYACCASEACCACYACCAFDASYAISANCASEACYACFACCAEYLSYNGSLFIPSYCESLSAYLLGVYP